MDLPTVALDLVFGHSPRKIVRFFIARMWIGYAIDAGEFAFTWIIVGMNFYSELWKWLFYGYVGGIGLVAFIITFSMIFCILRGKEEDGRIKRHKKVPYFMGYFKLTSAVNAGIVFFTLHYFGDKPGLTDAEEMAILAIKIHSGIDMGVNLIEMGLGFAGLNTQRLREKNKVHAIVIEDPVPTPPPVKSSKPKRKSKK